MAKAGRNALCAAYLAVTWVTICFVAMGDQAMWIKKMAQCEVCGREYLKTTPTRKYCSDECKELMKINLKRESQKARKANRKREIAQERRDDLNRILMKLLRMACPMANMWPI